MGSEIESEVTSYVTAALLGDRPEAARSVARLLAQGHDPARIIEDLLAPAQEMVGLHWQQARCSVGAEHTATGVTDAVLSTLTVGFEPDLRRGHVVLACAEGEWHALPARMASEQLILQGYQVTFLGAALPSDHLRRFLEDLDADIVAISCTFPCNLPGAARSVRAARRSGYPVIAGGRAFGTSPDRALAIGANGWAGTIKDGTDLAELATHNPPLPDLSFLKDVEIVHEVVVDAGFARVMRLLPQLARSGPQALSRTREDLDFTLQHAVAAFLVRDRSLFQGYLTWTEDILRARQLPTSWAALGAHALAEAMRPHHQGIADVLASAV